MSRYVGWNEAASRRARNRTAEGDLQLPYDGLVAPTQTLKSFIPINQGPVITSLVNHAVRNRSRGLDSDMLFDLPDEPLSGSPVPKGKGQTSKTPARPKKTPSSILAHPWPKVAEKESSQLGTPPDSKKRLSKRQSTQTGLFSSASITKPTLGPMKLITTEDVLKAKSASPGQTTMEKLASFRFQPTAQYLSGVEAYGIANSMEGVVEEPEMAHRLRHDATSHEEENPYHVFNGHGLTSHNEDDLYPVLDDHEPTSHDEEELYHEVDDPDHTKRNDEEPCHIFDEATVQDHDADMIMVSEAKMSMSRREVTPIVQPDAEDDFPVDDELETEMAQLSMPYRIYENASENLHQKPPQNKNLQSGDTNSVQFQLASRTSHTLVGNSNETPNIRAYSDSSVDSVLYPGPVPRPIEEAIDWPPVHGEEHDRASTGAFYSAGAIPPPQSLSRSMSLAEDGEYSPLKAFARPGFPPKVHDRSPIVGVSSNIILRTCFRIGEALREGALCEGIGQDAVIELFARSIDSSHDITPSKLRFEFADLFHDRPPFIRGTLEGDKISSLQETESRMLLGVDGPAPMVRCLGRLKRVIAGPPGWMLYIINIRPTDWEEVRWTRQIAGAGMMK